MQEAILNFPIPRTLTDVRTWFGLVNQVTLANSLGPVMLLFRDLVKWDSQFAWNKSLEDASQHSKQVIVDLVRKGITTFKKDRVTCLTPDWSKEGMGFLLLQKHCSWTTDKALVCCPDGWHLIFAGSRFCIDAECRYTLSESEAAAIAWALEKYRMFVKGCPDRIVVTDHEPLRGLFDDRDLSKIQNSRLFRLKEKNHKVKIYHSALLWEMAQSLCCRLPQHSCHFARAPKRIFCWTLSVRHSRVWWHGWLGQINNSIFNIRSKRQQSAHLTRPYPCNWTQRPTIQINRDNTKGIPKDAQPHCTRGPQLLGSEAPHQCWRRLCVLISTHKNLT